MVIAGCSFSDRMNSRGMASVWREVDEMSWTLSISIALVMPGTMEEDDGSKFRGGGGLVFKEGGSDDVARY